MPAEHRDIFISYSRSDADFARELYAKLETAGHTLWRDRSQMQGGSNWWEQIQEAIRAVDTMVLLLSPAALASPIVADEWRYARAIGVRVIPVVAAEVDFKTAPRWMRKRDWLDFRFSTVFATTFASQPDPEHTIVWEKFLNQLKTPLTRERVPFTAPGLTSHYVPRPVPMAALYGRLLNGAEPIPGLAALQGGGGFGKSTLAAALCHDSRIRDAFDDGVLWLTFGETPNVPGLLADQIRHLGGDPAAYSDPIGAAAYLRDLLGKRDILIVLDDVWDADHVRLFMEGGPNCARLITTRRQDVSARLGIPHPISLGQMALDEAAALLAQWLTPPPADSGIFRPLAHKLGEWPLLLRLAGAQLAEYVALDGMTPADAMTAVIEQLDTYGYTAFDRDNADEAARYSAIRVSLRVSLDRLGAGQKRFLELAVFPEDTEIPFASMIRLWGATAGLSRLDAENTIRAIQRLSLFVDYDTQNKFVRLHDVLRAIIVGQVGADLPGLHARFLDSFGVSAWADLPADEPYLWDHLFYHLRAAGREPELVSLAQDLRFAAARINARGNPGAGEIVIHPDSAVLGRITRIRIMFSRVAHLFPPPGNLTAIQHTVYARLANLIDLDGPLAAFEPTLSRPYVAPDHPLPDQPHPMLLRTLTGHTDKVRSVALFVGKNQTLAASGSRDNTIRIWSPLDGALKYTLTGHTQDIYGLAFSPDGRRLASGAHDEIIKVWDTQKGRETLTLRGHTDRVNGVAWSPDGRRIASGGWDSTARLWDAQTGELQQTFEGHSDGVLCVAFSPDGRQVATGSADRSVRVWDVESGECLHTLEGHTGWAFTLCYAANGDLITGGVDKTIRVWDAVTRAEKHTIENAHRSWIRAVAYLHNGSGGEIVSGSDDRTIKIWSLATGQLVESLVAHADWVSSLAAASGLFLSGSDDATLRVWDRVGVQTERTAPPQDVHANWVNAVAYTPDYTRVVSAASDRMIKVWDIATGQPLYTAEGHKHWTLGVALSPDGRRFASASRDKTVGVWDSATGNPMIPPLTGHEDWVNDVIFPDANTVISAGDDRRIIIWEWQIGKPRLTLSNPKGAVYAVATYDDVLASVGADQMVRLWNWRSGQPISVMAGHTDLIDCVAFSPDGKFLVTGGNDATIRLWEVGTGSLIRTLSGHTGHIYTAAFSPDGGLIASAALDATLRVWDAQTGAQLTLFRADGPMLACAWHADGVRIVASGARGVYWLRLVR